MPRNLLQNNSSDNDNSTSSIFLDEVAGIKDEFKKFRVSIKDLTMLYDKSLNSFSKEKIQENTDQLEKCNDFIKVQINTIKQKLDGLKKLPQEGINTEIKKIQYKIIREDFMKCIEEYQKIQKNQRHKTQGILVTKYKMINPDATQEEIEKATEDGKVDEMFNQNMTMSLRSESAPVVLKEVEQRKIQMTELLKSIEELNELYVELQYKVEEQDEIFDHVMVDMEETNNNLVTANGKINIAIKYALSARGKKMLLSIMILIVIIVLATLLFIFLKPSSSTTS